MITKLLNAMCDVPNPGTEKEHEGKGKEIYTSYAFQLIV